MIRQTRPTAHRFGGSHAQRDVIDLTMIDAARRNGDLPLARALVPERLQLEPGSGLNKALEVRLAA